MRIERAGLALLAVLTVAAASGAARAESCQGVDDGWALGGLAFAADTADLIKACKPDPYCNVEAAGVSYVVGPQGGAMRIRAKSRPLRLGEVLPYDLTSADMPDVALAKVRAAKLAAGFGRTAAPKPVSVVLICGRGRDDAFMLEFKFDQAGHMTGVSESSAGGGGFYVSDPTFHFQVSR